MYHKGKRTVEALSELLMLTEDLHTHANTSIFSESPPKGKEEEDEIYQFKAGCSPLRRSSILVHNNSYE